MQIKKIKKTTQLPPAEETKQSAEARFAWAAGADRLRQHDPLYHVTESFQQSFDRIGRSHAAAAAGGFHEESEEDPAGEKERLNTREKREPKQKDEKSSAESALGKASDTDTKQRPKEETSPLTRFSDIAFQRGKMSASVLNGTGKMMLVSCMKRTAFESAPKLQQQSISNTGSITRPIPGHSPDRLVFNRGFARSALGIVVDTLKDARRVVESMTDIARGAGETPESDRAALYKLYPFLDDSRDAELELEYRAKLAACTDEREKPVLQNALVRTLSLRAKKAQMKNEFINKLRFISDRATETLSELETAGIEEELAAAAFGEETPELPENPPDHPPENPPENPDKGADGDAPNGKKNGTDKTARKGASAGSAKAKR